MLLVHLYCSALLVGAVCEKRAKYGTQEISNCSFVVVVVVAYVIQSGYDWLDSFLPRLASCCVCARVTVVSGGYRVRALQCSDMQCFCLLLYLIVLDGN